LLNGNNGEHRSLKRQKLVTARNISETSKFVLGFSVCFIKFAIPKKA
jgi:hypothetical protein